MGRHAFALYILGLSLLFAGMSFVDDSEPLPPQTAGSSLSSYFKHAGLAAYTADGLVDYRIELDQIDYYGDSKVTYFTGVKMHYLASTARTDLTADAGRLNEEKDEIYLQGEVRIFSEEYGRGSPSRSRVQTRDVTVDIDRRSASTAAPVSIHQDHQRLDGTGMEADLVTGRIRILNDVKASRKDEL